MHFPDFYQLGLYWLSYFAVYVAFMMNFPGSSSHPFFAFNDCLQGSSGKGCQETVQNRMFIFLGLCPSFLCLRDNNDPTRLFACKFCENSLLKKKKQAKIELALFVFFSTLIFGVAIGFSLYQNCTKFLVIFSFDFILQ